MRNIYTLACLLLAFSVRCSYAQSVSIGTEYRDVHELVGFERKNSTAINLHYGVAHVKSLETGKNLLVASKFVDANRGDNDFKLRVIDVVEIPMHKEEYFSVCLKGCHLNGKPDSSLFALVVSGEKKLTTNIIKVWKLNRQTGMIETFSQKGISCLQTTTF
jgi:hypothetical protein